MEDDIGYEWWWYGIFQVISVIHEQVSWITGKLRDHSCCVVLFGILCIFLWSMFKWFPKSIIGKIELVGVFFFFNAVLPGADMVTDMLNVIDLYEKDNPIWATISLFWIFMPFLLKFFALLFIVYEGELDKKRRYISPKKICQTVIFFPFVLPLLNTVLSLKLTMINVADSRNANQIEKIKKIAALASLYESFFESGPQLLTQIHIVLCTGEISNIQIFSMAVSFFTLTLAACKAFFVQRDSEQADPEPSLHMVLRVFPYMSVVIINSTLQWTIITGLSKGFVFLTIPLVFCTTLIVLKRKELSTMLRTKYELILLQWGGRGKQIYDNQEEIQQGEENVTYKINIQDKGGDCDVREEEASQVKTDRQIADNSDVIQEGKEKELLKLCTMDIQDEGGDCDIGEGEAPQIEIDSGNVMEEDDKHQEVKRDKTYYIDLLVNMAEVPELNENYFSLKAAMTSLWVPCVVGKKNQKTFNKSAYSSLIFKTLVLIISIVLALTGSYPHFVQKGTFMLFCFDDQTLDSLNQLQTNSTFGVCNKTLVECFKQTNTKLVQILHLCDEGDDLVKKILLGFTITFFGIALLATYCLNSLSNYITLYDISKTFMWIPIKWADPIFHRNLVFQILGEKKYKKLRDLEVNDSCLKALNRQNSNGQSPLNIALENEDYNSVSILLKRGVNIERDSREHPLRRGLIIAIQNNDPWCLQYFLKHYQEGEIDEIWQSVFDWFGHPENYISSKPTFGSDPGGNMEEISGKGIRDIRSITVFTGKSRQVTFKSPCGLEVLWSDGSIEKFGLDNTHPRVTKTKVVTAPEEGYFTYVRCKSGDIVDAIAFDTEDPSGKIIRGELIGGTGGDYRQSLECFDVDHMSVVLDGIKGKLDDGYYLALTNLTFTYRIVQRKNKK